MKRLAVLLCVGVLASGAGAFLVSNTRVGSVFVPEKTPANRRPLRLLVDTEPVPGVANPAAVTQDLMNQWNAVNEADDPFGDAVAGGPYNAATSMTTFGTFTNTQYEVAWDDTGEILMDFGIGTSVLGITLKSVDTGRGDILDFLIVVNTRPGFLSAPGTGATSEELFRATLLHELGHAIGLGHSPVGMSNLTTFGLVLAAPVQMPTMFPFRLPGQPQDGGTINGDDIAGLTQIYPGDTSALGSLSGTVRGVSGAPVNEIAVRAVGPAGAGEQHYGILTDVDASGQGRFTIPNLPAGPYRVLIEPVNGRSSVSAFSLAGSTDSLGGDAFILATDELWEPGDTWDPALDTPTDFEFVMVRAGRDTGSIDFVLNAEPRPDGATVNRNLSNGDAQLPDDSGGFHFVDYHVFRATAGADVTIRAASGAVIPQLQLLRPSDLAVEAEELPTAGVEAVLMRTVSETGLYIVAVSALATTGNPGGSGGYQLTVTGGSGALPPSPVVTGATLQRGAADAGAQQFSSPVCSGAMLQLEVTAPSHEELWVDRVTVRATGTGHEVVDVPEVRVVEDRNGNGMVDAGEPVLARGQFTDNDGTLELDDLGLELEPGDTTHLLVVYDVAVLSVSSATAGFSAWWGFLLVLPLLWLRRPRLVALLLVVALLPLSCGGGGGGGCNGVFNPDGAIAGFTATVDAGGVRAFTPTTDPAIPLDLVPTPIASGTLEVSN